MSTAIRDAGRSQRGLICGALVAAVLASQCAAATASDLVGLIARSKPAIVAVGTYSATDSPRFGFRGTGFAVAPDLVVTNAHVLPTATASGSTPRTVIVARSDGRPAQPRDASIVGRDDARDLALLRVSGPALPTLPLATEEVQEGAAVALIGFPLGGALGFTPVTHRAIVSAITAIVLPNASAQTLTPEATRRLRGGSFEIYQLDGTAYPGNSGGPVLDVTSGAVVGVVNSVVVKGSKESALTNPSGITYAIPVKFVQALLAAHAVPLGQ